MTTNKTQTIEIEPKAYISSLEHPVRRADSHVLLELLGKASNDYPKMWGESIIGFGHYHYRYESGHEGDSFRVGFAPRKANLVVYIMPGYGDFSEILSRLGKHRMGKSCLYINKLADIDLEVLEELLMAGLERMQQLYPTSL